MPRIGGGRYACHSWITKPLGAFGSSPAQPSHVRAVNLSSRHLAAQTAAAPHASTTATSRRWVPSARCATAPRRCPPRRAPGGARRWQPRPGIPPAPLPGVPHDMTMGTIPRSRLLAACAIGFRRCRPRTTPGIHRRRKRPRGGSAQTSPLAEHHATTSRTSHRQGCLPHVPQCSVVAHGEQLQASVRVGCKRRGRV